ncbi:nucleoside recognition domain-containing protein [Tissierella sp.]|uniref:nucleoside recognition domain-containing protein n=1 Tax=Tissierella sp. TaxID=41274 RepID=UPI0028A8AF32|nr:nucleoside recognition domain-containing protein [Tissierella sp.]
MDSTIRGFKKGLITLWKLTKIVVPVYFFVTFLKMTPILDMISMWFEPAMKLLGLPGEASLVLVLGNCINLYAGIGAITSLTLDIKQITILAIMLSFSHSLFLETAVAKKTGVNLFVVISIRLALAIVSGLILNILL